MSSNNGGSAGEPDIMATTGGVVAGIVICSLLFLVVIGLIGYNLYLWKRRRLASKRHRSQLANRQWRIDNGWRPKDILYSSQDDVFKGNGNVNAAYQGSTGSVAIRTTGPSGGSNVQRSSKTSTGSMAGPATKRSGFGQAPKAQHEDDSISDEEGNDALRSRSSSRPGIVNGMIKKPLRPGLRVSRPSGNGYSHNNQAYLPPQVHAYGTRSPNYPRPSPSKSNMQLHYDNGLHNVVAVPRQEVTLRPDQLTAQWDRKPPPPTFSQHRHPEIGRQSSCLTLLSAEAANMRAHDVRTCDISLTGCGAQFVPQLGLVVQVGRI